MQAKLKPNDPFYKMASEKTNSKFGNLNDFRWVMKHSTIGPDGWGHGKAINIKTGTKVYFHEAYLKGPAVLESEIKEEYGVDVVDLSR